MKEKRKMDNQSPLIRRIWKWVWRLGLIITSLIIVIWIATEIMFYPSWMADLNRYRVCNNTPPPQPLNFPDTLISLDELNTVIIENDRVLPPIGIRHDAALIRQYPTHPQGKFYFVKQYNFYSYHIFICPLDTDSEPHYFQHAHDSDIFIWARQNERLYVVEIEGWYGYGDIVFHVYDGDTLELIAQNYYVHSD